MSQDQTQPASCNQIIETKKTSKKKDLKEKQKTYKLGFAYLSSNVKRKEHLRFFPASVIKALQNQIFQFPVGIKRQQKYHLQTWNKRFSFMVQTDLIEFNSNLSLNPTILISIQHIKFNYLKYLNLYRANIQNFQSLSHLNTPLLQRMNLIYNKCHNFQSLAKINVPNLKQLCLYIVELNPEIGMFDIDNITKQNFNISNIDRWNFNLDTLRLQKHETDYIILSDLSKLAKLKQSPQIIMCQTYRINSKTVRSILKQKQIKFCSYRIFGQLRQFQPLERLE